MTTAAMYHDEKMTRRIRGIVNHADADENQKNDAKYTWNKRDRASGFESELFCHDFRPQESRKFFRGMEGR